MYNTQLETFIRVADAGKSLYQDAKYIIRYCKFDETMLDLRSCAGLELSREPFCCSGETQRDSYS